jgi:hypothetical protein
MKLSIPKTVIGKNLFEFAKRVFYDGTEISPINFTSWIKSMGDLAMIRELLRIAGERGVDSLLNPPESVLISKIFKSYALLCQKERQKDARWINNVLRFETQISRLKESCSRVDDVIAVALAPNSYGFRSTYLESPDNRKVCNDILYEVFHRKLLQSLEP